MLRASLIIAAVFLTAAGPASAMTREQARYQADSYSFTLAFDVLIYLMDDGAVPEEGHADVHVGVSPRSCRLTSRKSAVCVLYGRARDWPVECRRRVRIVQRGINLVPILGPDTCRVVPTTRLTW